MSRVGYYGVLLVLCNIHVYIFCTTSNDVLEKAQFEAAFQGKCGHESPCDQLCYELHDGMFECDCKEGFVLHEDGYSCSVENITTDGLLKEDPLNISQDEGEDILYQKDTIFSAKLDALVNTSTGLSTSTGDYVQFVTSSVSTNVSEVSSVDNAKDSCLLECGSGICVLTDVNKYRCQCPLGKALPQCSSDVSISVPKFSGQSWIAFSALHAAYKHVQAEIQFKPESWDGILFLTGERDDLNGDFMTLLIFEGYVEFRFDCGSGIGMVKSDNQVILDDWNTVRVFRHRWDAWIQLNDGNKIKGRSKGLFSRITFREPVFVGGRGNTSGLSDKLPTEKGFKGCIRHLDINDHLYNFNVSPGGDSLKGIDVEECLEDKCNKTPCEHGGKCITTPGSSYCLCPLGFTGDLCQTRLDLQVPQFNGSSYLRYQGLGEQYLSLLDLTIVFKAIEPNGILLYNGHRADGVGDFIALYLNDRYVDFTFDLGTGAATLRSSNPISLGEWHKLRLTRTGRHAYLQVDRFPSSQILSPGPFTQLSLSLSLYLGGVPDYNIVSPKVKIKSSFIGCIQKVLINNHELNILGEAIQGVNVVNCAHPCITQPCGSGSCVPLYDGYKCVCTQSCKESHLTEVMCASFDHGASFLHYLDPEIIHRITGYEFNIDMRIKTSSSSGLILWTGSSQSKDFLALGIHNGYAHVMYNLGNGEVLLENNQTKINNGVWHRLTVHRTGKQCLIRIDTDYSMQSISGGKFEQLNTDSGLYVGGVEDIEELTRSKYHHSFKGWISNLILSNDYQVKLPLSRSQGSSCQLTCETLNTGQSVPNKVGHSVYPVNEFSEKHKVEQNKPINQ
ncbi:hypothetical protein M8J75_014484 [Diaphorina citri]|nr:hypothetical protein M8J75_014484 [Diaphorina citri]